MQTWKHDLGELCYDSVESQDIKELRDVAKKREEFYGTHGIRFPADVCPAEAAATLRSRFFYVPSDSFKSPLEDIVSYPAYLFTQLSNHFPDVHRSDLNRTVDQLLRCYTRYAIH